jgi:hypothetical protein
MKGREYPRPAGEASSSAGTLVSPEDAKWLRKLIRTAFLVRVVVALVLHWGGGSTRFAGDEDTYSRTGQALAHYWAMTTLVKPWRLTADQPHGYFYLNGVSYYLFDSAIPLLLVNVLLGSLCCRYAFLLASALFGPGVARRTALLVAFLPSLVLWSALNIRDVWVIFLILVISWKTCEIVAGFSAWALAEILLAMAVLNTLREYLFLVVALPPVVAILIGRRGHLARNFVFASLGAAGLVFMVQQGAGAHAFRSMTFERLAESRQGLTLEAASAFETDVDISTPGRALAFLPTGLAYFLFSPFPWQITSFLKVVSLPEVLFLYWLTPSIVRGLRYTVKHRFRQGLQVLLLTALLTVSYSLGSGNVGTLFRHRAQAIIFFLMFGAVGREILDQRRQAVAPTPFP